MERVKVLSKNDFAKFCAECNQQEAQEPVFNLIFATSNLPKRRNESAADQDFLARRLFAVDSESEGAQRITAELVKSLAGQDSGGL